MSKSNAKVRDRVQLNEIAKMGYLNVREGLKNLINIRANTTAEILTTGNEEKKKEKLELLNGINDRIKELLILE